MKKKKNPVHPSSEEHEPFEEKEGETPQPTPA